MKIKWWEYNLIQSQCYFFTIWGYTFFIDESADSISNYQVQNRIFEKYISHLPLLEMKCYNIEIIISNGISNMYICAKVKNFYAGKQLYKKKTYRIVVSMYFYASNTIEDNF